LQQQRRRKRKDDELAFDRTVATIRVRILVSDIGNTDGGLEKFKLEELADGAGSPATTSLLSQQLTLTTTNSTPYAEVSE
jgi:hypothetical protein